MRNGSGGGTSSTASSTGTSATATSATARRPRQPASDNRDCDDRLRPYLDRCNDRCGRGRLQLGDRRALVAASSSPSIAACSRSSGRHRHAPARFRPRGRDPGEQLVALGHDVARSPSPLAGRSRRRAPRAAACRECCRARATGSSVDSVSSASSASSSRIRAAATSTAISASACATSAARSRASAASVPRRSSRSANGSRVPPFSVARCAREVGDAHLEPADLRVPLLDLRLHATDRAVPRGQLGQLLGEVVTVRTRVGELLLGGREADHLVLGAVPRVLGRTLQAALGQRPGRLGAVELGVQRGPRPCSSRSRVTYSSSRPSCSDSELRSAVHLVHDALVLVLEPLELVGDLGPRGALGAGALLRGAPRLLGAQPLELAAQRRGFVLRVRPRVQLLFEALVLVGQDPPRLLRPTGSCAGPRSRARPGVGGSPGGPSRSSAAPRPDRRSAPAAESAVPWACSLSARSSSRSIRDPPVRSVRRPRRRPPASEHLTHACRVLFRPHCAVT